MTSFMKREILGLNSGQTDTQPRRDAYYHKFGNRWETCPMSRKDPPKICCYCKTSYKTNATCCRSNLCIDCHVLFREYLHNDFEFLASLECGLNHRGELDSDIYCLNCGCASDMSPCGAQLCIDCHDLYCRCSQLNGSHGEWTNSDDVSGLKGVDYADHARRARENWNRRHRTGRTNDKKTKHKAEPSIPPVQAAAIAAALANPDKPIHEREEPSYESTNEESSHTHPLPKHLKGAMFFPEYTIYYSQKLGFYANPLDSHCYELALDETYGSFDKNDNFVQGPDHYHLLAYTPTVKFKYFGYEYKLSDQLYSPLLVQWLARDIPLPSEDARNLRAINAYIAKKAGALSLAIQVASAHMYLYQLSCLNPTTIQATSLDQTTLPLLCTSFSRRALEIPASICQLPLDWNYNNRFRIECRGGAQFDFDPTYGTMFSKTLRQYPVFPTIREEGDKYKNIAYCKFSPQQEFEYYDVCAENCTPALSRLLKSRPNEDELFTNQLGLIVPEHFECLRLASATVVREGNLWSRGGISDTRSIVTRNASVTGGAYTYNPHPDIEYHRAVQRARFPKASWFAFFWKAAKFSYTAFTMFTKAVRGSIAVACDVSQSLVSIVYSPLYYLYEKLDWLRAVVQLPSPKKALYHRWVENEPDFKKIVANDGNFTLKLKREEGKYGKAGRLYGSGEHLCLVDKILPDVIKNDDLKSLHLHEILYDNLRADPTIRPDLLHWRFTMRFSLAQDAPTSDALFREGLNLQPCSILFVYFSDDAFIIMKDEFGHIRVLEVDISSCDSSNGPAQFCILHELLSKYNKDSADMLILQATRKARLHNPDNKNEFFEFTPDTFFQYSGLLITSIINNSAIRTIATQIFLEFLRTGDLSSAKDAAHKVGYIITIDEFESCNQVTFLKRAYSVIAARSWKVLGTLLRGFGVVEGGLTPDILNVSRSEFRSMSETEKFIMLCRQRLMGEKNEPGNPVLNALYEKFGLPVKENTITTADLMDRYGGEVWEWEDFYNKIYELDLGVVIRHPVVNRIFLKDYGVKIPT